jgi:hypothetical protein
MTIFVVSLVSCSDDIPTGNINPYKTYDQYTTEYDYIAFGIQHQNPKDLALLGLNEDEIEYLTSQFGKNPGNIEDGWSSFTSTFLCKNDIINLGILNNSQQAEFESYCERTKSNAFNIAFIIPKDENSNNFGKQIINIRNLNSISESLQEDGLGYHLYFESTILDYNQIINEAKNVLNCEIISRILLNDTFGGIYLHHYSVSEEKLILNFYVIGADVIIEDEETYLDHNILKWFEIVITKKIS